MRLFLTAIAITALLVQPATLLAGDKVHHGHGMRSGWDSQTGSGFQGSEYIGGIPDFYRVYPRKHYRYGYNPGYQYYGNQGYGYSGFNVTYSNGNLGASFDYSRRTTPYRPYPNYYSPACGNFACGGGCATCLNYAPAQYYAAPYGYAAQPANVYSTPNYQRYPSPPIWSAAPNPDLGYYARPAQSYQQQQQQPQVVNIFNYYGEEFSEQQPSVSQQQPAAPAPKREAAPEPQRQAQENAVGTKFYSSAQLNTATNSMVFSLDNGTLYAGPESGPPLPVATGVDEKLGVLAAWQPGLGYSLVYRTGDVIVATWNNGSDWLEEPLPEFIDFSKEVTIGMVAGSPWIVFNGFDGSRQIYTFAGGWYKLGSATQPAEDADAG